MPKNIRQKIARALQTTFRSSSQDRQSSLKSKISTCCSVTKPKDYEYISYQPKQPLSSSSSSSRHDYVDLSECHSWSSSDSGVSVHTNISSISSSNPNCHPLQSTRTVADDSCSLSTFSDLSYIPHDQMNVSNFDVTAWQPVATTSKFCDCSCHHPMTNNLLRNGMYDFRDVVERSRSSQRRKGVLACHL